MVSTQPSQLLASLFSHIGEQQRLNVLHIGPAVGDTVAFFSDYRCRLQFVDLFDELPIVASEDEGPSLPGQFAEWLQFPADTQFDICLFWDIFNYLSSDAVSAFVGALRPYLHAASLAHAFSVHNVNTPQGDQQYAIRGLNEISVRPRDSVLPAYAPHTQSKLKTLLDCFNFERSVLLSDRRLELLLRASLKTPHGGERQGR